MTVAEPPPPGPHRTEGGRTRVATIPHADAYVDAVLPPDVVHVGRAGSPWMDPGHLAAHAGQLDVVHVHTGSVRLDRAEAERWTETVRRLGVPLVVTVHEVADPEHPACARRIPAPDAHLRPLLDTAEVVFTLTSGAADEIAVRFGRTAIVVAHPSVAEPDPDLGADRGLVGLRLRPSSDPDTAVLVRAALSGAVSGGGRLRVLVDAAEVPALDPTVAHLAAQGELELVVHGGADAAAQLQRLHVAVLPERCGTHSRDLEICRDVGTAVVVPGCGWFAGQWSEVVGYGVDDGGAPDPVSLTAAVAAALTRPIPRPADRAWRVEQRAAVQRVHAEVYARVAADRCWV